MPAQNDQTVIGAKGVDGLRETLGPLSSSRVTSQTSAQRILASKPLFSTGYGRRSSASRMVNDGAVHRISASTVAAPNARRAAGDATMNWLHRLVHRIAAQGWRT